MFKIEKILISDAVDPMAIEILRKKNIQCDLRPGLPKDELISIIKNYDALIVRSGTQVTKDVIEASEGKLKLIGRAGVGVDNIDLNSATSNGIIVINAPGGNTISAAELTCAMILSTSRHIPQACAKLKMGQWDRKTFVGNEILGKTLAIIGLGRIGKEIAQRMQSFGMRTIGFDPIVSIEQAKEFGVEWLNLEQIWPLADFITVHTPLIPQTKNMINSDTFSKCKKGVRIINVARGGIVDENDLLKALENGQCGGAGLDVFVDEPPNQSTMDTLIKHPLVVCTPHLGASTKEAQNNVAKEIALQILDLLERKPIPGCVNAPLLSDMLKHTNLLWINLGRNLGKLMAIHSPKTKSLSIKINGFEATKVSKLIKESILVGYLTIHTGKEIKLISASNLAKNLSIDFKLLSDNDDNDKKKHCCFSSIELIDNDNDNFKLIGIPQGRRSYLQQFNDKIFEPVIAMENYCLTLIQLKSVDDEKNFLNWLVNDDENNGKVLSWTRSKNDRKFLAIHSNEFLDLNLLQKYSIFVDQIDFR